MKKQVSIGIVRANCHVAGTSSMWTAINPNGTVSRLPWDARYARHTNKFMRQSGSNKIYIKFTRLGIFTTLVDQYGRIRDTHTGNYFLGQ